MGRAGLARGHDERHVLVGNEEVGEPVPRGREVVHSTLRGHSVRAQRPLEGVEHLVEEDVLTAGRDYADGVRLVLTRLCAP